MSEASRSSESLASHAVCVAAGARDGLRTAQFLMRVLAGTESWGRTGHAAGLRHPAQRRRSILSSTVSRLARSADRALTWVVDRLIARLAPDWRKLPSPFTHGMLNEVSKALLTESFTANPLFNAYFYRSAIHILRRYGASPLLVLEHRVDTARRTLAEAGARGEQTEAMFLARALIALVEAAPVARAGAIRPSAGFDPAIAPNVLVFAIACIALLFAEEGKPAEQLDEDQFFAVVGALIGARLEDIAALVARADPEPLARELADIKSMY